MATQSIDPNQTTSLSFEEAAEKKWVPYMTKNSYVCDVKFCDGSTKKCAVDSESEMKDIIVIGPGSKSSYSMGEILSVYKGKMSNVVQPLILFSANPTRGAIQKCGLAISPYYGSRISEVCLGSNIRYGKFVPSDIHLLYFLNAAAILAYPEFAGPESMKEAQKILSGTFSIPNFVFGCEMNDRFIDGFTSMGFSGFYPGWKDGFMKMSVFAECEARSPYIQLDEDSNLFKLKEVNNRLIFVFEGSSEVQHIFEEHPEFQSFYHLHVIRSALSLLIRGGFTNLLEAALSVRIPEIDIIIEQLASLACDIGSIPCLEVIYGKREAFGVKSFKNKLENDVTEHLDQWKARPKATPKADSDMEEVTITYDKYLVKASVQVKGDERILAGIPLSSCSFLEKTADRSWKIVEEKLIPDVIRNFNNGEVRFGTAEPYLYETKMLWSELSKHGIALITQESAAHISELKNKLGNRKDNKPTGKLRAAIEKHIAEDGFSFEDTVGAVLGYWNSFASLDRSLFISILTPILENCPRKKDGSLKYSKKVILPISLEWLIYIDWGTTSSREIQFNIWPDGSIHI